ncbi:unnamed protein product, partial [Didymodactylos carnosus]
ELYYRDFRRTSAYSFQFLSQLCRLSQQTINDALLTLQSTAYITFTLISKELFLQQTQLSIQQFQSSTINDFLFTFDFIQSTTHANGLLSNTMTNYQLRLVSFLDFIYYHLTTQPSQYNQGNCTCDNPTKCFELSAIYNSNFSVEFQVPGFYLGCYLTDSLLQSTLECFYSQQCLKQIQFYYSTTNYNITPLNSTLPSQYKPQTTVQQMLNQLMIEQWLITISYENYYQQCRPMQCQYSYIHSFD